MIEADQPNVIVITTHDSGRHFGCYGIDTVHTPNIDAIASDGVRLTNYFSASPICCAARGAVMTGQYPQTNGQMDLCFNPFNYDLNDYQSHASWRFRNSGYHSLLFGIQHETNNLDALGYHERYSVGKPRKTAFDTANALADYLKSDDVPTDKPFFAQVGFFETHSPFDFGGVDPDDEHGVTVPPYVKDNETARRVMRQFQGAIRCVDDAVGIITDALSASGLADNTILVFTTDHGLEVPRAKWHMYDPGIGIACVIRWPNGNVTGGRTCDFLLSGVDFLPTMFDLCNIDQPNDFQGVSFADGLTGKSNAKPPRDAVFSMFNRSALRSVRSDRYKLIRKISLGHAGVSGFFLQYSDESFNVNYPDGAGHKYDFAKVELYDLDDDPLEFNNRADDPALADVQAELDGKLWQWMEDVDDPLLKGPPRLPYYDDVMDQYKQWKEAEHAS